MNLKMRNTIYLNNCMVINVVQIHVPKFRHTRTKTLATQISRSHCLIIHNRHFQMIWCLSDAKAKQDDLEWWNEELKKK